MATGWLVFSGLLWLASSIQFLDSSFLDGCPWVTVGHLQPAAWNVLLYGFVIQAGLGVLLWLLARLGNSPISPAHGPVLIFGGLIWNLGVALGLFGILRGDNTGFSWLEFPRYATPLLFFSYLLFSVVAVLTFARRRRPELYVTQWYLVAALFWFPWIFSTAVILLTFQPVRGVAQVVVSGWFKAGLGGVWVAGIGLGVVYYMLPKLLNRPLHSRALANLGFWTTLFFAGWNVVSPTAPVPAWIASASTAAALLMLIPVLAFAVNISSTACGAFEKEFPRTELLFVLFASVFYVLSNLEMTWAAKRGVAEVVRFTLFGTAEQIGLVYGFGVMSLMGAICYLTPRLLGLEEGAFKVMPAQFWTSATGVVLLVFVFTFGGIEEGGAVNNARLGYTDVMGATHYSLAAGVMGVALLFAGQILHAAQFYGVIGRTACEGLCDIRAELVADDSKPAGAKV